MKNFFSKNEGATDRIIRAVLGIGAAIVALLTTGGIQIAFGIIAVILLITAATGFCGLYKLFGIKTCPASPPPPQTPVI